MNYTFIKDSSIRLSTSSPDLDYVLGAIKHSLTRYVKNYMNSTITKVEFFIEDDKHLIIPRYTPIHTFLSPTTTFHLTDNSTRGQSIVIDHNITLRNDVQVQTVNYMLNSTSGIIQLSPGAGKTVISIYVIAKLKLKSLILVHRTSLVEQWMSRFLTFTTLNEDDIEVFDSTRSVFSKSITISTVQSFVSAIRRNKEEFWQKMLDADIGVTIADEVHTTVGAPVFSECSLFIPTRIFFGLSATPKRNDNTSDIIEYHLGPIYTPIGESDTLDAKVTVLIFDFGISRASNRYIYWAGLFQKARYLNLLKKSPLFVAVCESVLRKLIGEQRSIVFISERLKLIDYLFDKIDYFDDKSKFISSEKNDKLNYKLVFSTPNKIRDGIDVPEKDCLVMTSPIGNIEQICGRVTRRLVGKKQPIIIDMVDNGCIDISKTLYRRLSYYRKKSWEVDFFIIKDNDNKFNAQRIINEKDVKNILRGQ